ncbi:MAG: arginine deiminase-related protein [Flavobacteriales bacterium]|nr:arginine deiminase-related protein [Flavobacteriales bacterium]
MQSTQSVLMIRPVSFRMNEETAENNHYQSEIADSSAEEILDLAQLEFDALVEALTSKGVRVHVIDESSDHITPDALFPNNWISTHADGKIGLYPMFAKNRRLERREDILLDLEHLHGYSVQDVVDFSEFEEHQKFLEGTGSLVLDRAHGKAYAALSPRTDRGALGHFCSVFDLEGIAFTALQSVKGERVPIYHTNVMMSIGTKFVAICLDAIDDIEERQMVVDSLKEDGLRIIALTEDQINHFAGNMLELQGSDGPIIAMSSAAFKALTDEQKNELEPFGELVHVNLSTIEKCGGGSARCMIAEIHLPKEVATH